MSTDIGQAAIAQALEKMTSGWVNAEHVARQRGSVQYEAGYNKAAQDMQQKLNSLQHELDLAKANNICAQKWIFNYRDAIVQARGQKWFDDNVRALTAEGQKAYEDYLTSRGHSLE